MMGDKPRNVFLDGSSADGWLATQRLQPAQGRALGAAPPLRAGGEAEAPYGAGGSQRELGREGEGTPVSPEALRFVETAARCAYEGGSGAPTTEMEEGKMKKTNVLMLAGIAILAAFVAIHLTGCGGLVESEAGQTVHADGGPDSTTVCQPLTMSEVLASTCANCVDSQWAGSSALQDPCNPTKTEWHIDCWAMDRSLCQ